MKNMNPYLMSNYCVYVYKDCQAVIRYIGHGNTTRPKSMSNRPKIIQDMFSRKELYVEVIHDNLTKLNAEDIENEYLNKYLNIKTDEWDLLNIKPASKVKQINHKVLSEFLEYDATSPTFLRWKVDRTNGSAGRVIVKKGDPAGRISQKGYADVTVNNISYKVHRVIYAILNSIDLDVNLVVHHKNGIKSDNTISNLELVTQKENSIKSKRDIRTNVGVIGVFWRERDRVYVSTYCENYKVVQRTFNPTKYGSDTTALDAAKSWREINMERIYGKDYSIV